MKPIIPKTRLFLVGCPRSGTTLLQSLLVAHPEILSFPESHFFRSLLEYRTPWRIKLKIASSKTKPRLKQFLKESGYEEMQRHIPQIG
ncbi:MAG TPA: sulfotransferase [Oculatellaceae cyanobacterium]|jgi:type II secretory pathway predicted ATPase ExeA